MKIFVVLLSCTAAFALTVQNVSQYQSPQNPEIQTVLGKIRGSVLQTRQGQPIYSYRGIRYAEAPVGANRFRQAVPAKPYSQTLDASQDGPACPQPGSSRKQSEDCLRLNVYTRQAPADNQAVYQSSQYQPGQQGNQQQQQSYPSNYYQQQGQQGQPGQQSQQGQYQPAQQEQQHQLLQPVLPPIAYLQGEFEPEQVYVQSQQQGQQGQYQPGQQGQYQPGQQQIYGQNQQGQQGQYQPGQQGQYQPGQQQIYAQGQQGQYQPGQQGQYQPGQQGQYQPGQQQIYAQGQQGQYQPGQQGQYQPGQQGQYQPGQQSYYDVYAQNQQGQQGQYQPGQQGQYQPGQQQLIYGQNQGQQGQYQPGQQYPGQQGQQGHQQQQYQAGYTPYQYYSDQQNSHSNRNVIVFFHPGGFYSSSGTSADFGPEYLLDHDVVLVTVNYRLGSLGFLSTGDAHAPGNIGLKDQVEALRWVQKNIARFGGNPNSVTIMGYGTGAMSVSLHMVSPMSRGLFHRAIALSGAATYQNPLPTNQQYLAQKQAQFLGCPTDNHDNMLNCLRSKPADAFGKTVPQFAEWQNDPVFIWAPVVEPEVPGVERFLPAQPADLIRQGRINAAPLLVGSNRDEFGSAIIRPTEEAQRGNNTVFNDINANWNRIAPISFFYDRNGPKSSYISKELKSYYLNDQPVSQNNVRGLARLYGDALIGFQSYRFAKLMAENSQQPVYNYHFVADGKYSFAKWSNGSNFGVVHHDDLLYLFKIGSFPQISSSDSQEMRTLERYTAIIANFAKYGSPVAHDNSELSQVSWQPTTPNQPKYMEFGQQLQQRQGYIYADRMNKLEQLFPLFPVGSASQ